jgi:hypothetical protein
VSSSQRERRELDRGEVSLFDPNEKLSNLSSVVADERANGKSRTSSGDGEGRNRTGDTTVFSRVLYQLSYLASDGEV